MVFFFFWLDVYGCVLSQSNHEHFQKGLDFSREALLLYIIFPKINRKPNNSKTEGGKGHTGPPGQPQGEELLCRFLSRPVTLSRPGHILVIPEVTYWAPGAAPCDEELPCRFLSCPVTLSQTGHIPAAPDTKHLMFLGNVN